MAPYPPLRAPMLTKIRKLYQQMPTNIRNWCSTRRGHFESFSSYPHLSCAVAPVI